MLNLFNPKWYYKWKAKHIIIVYNKHYSIKVNYEINAILKEYESILTNGASPKLTFKYLNYKLSKYDELFKSKESVNTFETNILFIGKRKTLLEELNQIVEDLKLLNTKMIEVVDMVEVERVNQFVKDRRFEQNIVDNIINEEYIMFSDILTDYVYKKIKD